MTTLEQMLMELESSRLEVHLVPLNPRLRNYNEGGCKRVKAGVNTKWYRDFVARHPSSRGVRHGKFDTRIRRANVERLLRRLIAQRPVWSKYAAEILRVAGRREA